VDGTPEVPALNAQKLEKRGFAEVLTYWETVAWAIAGCTQGKKAAVGWMMECSRSGLVDVFPHKALGREGGFALELARMAVESSSCRGYSSVAAIDVVVPGWADFVACFHRSIPWTWETEAS